MYVETHVCFLKGTRLDHVQLSVQVLLGGCSVEDDLAAELVHRVLQRDTSSHRSGCYDVMTAGMTDLGESVVFRCHSNGNSGTSAVIAGPESPGYVAEVLRYFEIPVLEVGYEDPAGLLFSPADLGVLIEISLYIFQLIKLIFHAPYNAVSCCPVHRVLLDVLSYYKAGGMILQQKTRFRGSCFFDYSSMVSGAAVKLEKVATASLK